MTWTAPEKIAALDFGTGEAELTGEQLALGPLSAWFGRF